jgi:hypothetical protein
MAPADKKKSNMVSSPAKSFTPNTQRKIRKRVRKTCDRRRIKKTKCDGSSPCLRCKTDDVICCAKWVDRPSTTTANHIELVLTQFQELS